MESKRKPFVIGGKEIGPGRRRSLEIPIADIYTHTTVTMPLKVIHGRRSGPVCFLSAAVHGDELNGVEIIRRVLASSQLKGIRGTLICVPVVNVFGFRDNSRYLPDRRDLNRCFPGSEKGSMSGRLAYTFMNEVVAQSDYGIDLHTGSDRRTNLPQIRACLDDEEVERLSKVFAAPVILDAPLRVGSLREVGMGVGSRVLVYETGEAMVFDELGIRTGVRGVLNVLRAIGMLSSRKPSKRAVRSHIVRSSTWVRAPQGGMLNSRIKLGQAVTMDQPLGRVADIFGENGQEVLANANGIVIGATTMPLVNEGNALFHIARHKDADTISETVDTLREVVLDPDQVSEDLLMDDE